MWGPVYGFIMLLALPGLLLTEVFGPIWFAVTEACAELDK